MITMTKIDLSGNYLKSGHKIILSEASSLLIKERKKASLTKTLNYLVFETKGKQAYCSSLYPTEKSNTFNADYSGIKYTITFSNDSVLIKNRGGHK